MVDITILEVHVDGITADLPFGSIEERDETDDASAATDDGSNRGKLLVVTGVLVFLVAAAAAVKHLAGGSEDVAIDTDDVSVPLGEE